MGEKLFPHVVLEGEAGGLRLRVIALDAGCSVVERSDGRDILGVLRWRAPGEDDDTTYHAAIELLVTRLLMVEAQLADHEKQAAKTESMLRSALDVQFGLADAGPATLAYLLDEYLKRVKHAR